MEEKKCNVCGRTEANLVETYTEWLKSAEKAGDTRKVEQYKEWLEEPLKPYKEGGPAMCEYCGPEYYRGF